MRGYVKGQSPSHANKGHAWLTTQDRLKMLLELVAEEQRPCKACGQELYFVRNRKTGLLMPLTKHGVHHLGDCPSTGGQLFESSPLPG